LIRCPMTGESVPTGLDTETVVLTSLARCSLRKGSNQSRCCSKREGRLTSSRQRSLRKVQQSAGQFRGPGKDKVKGSLTPPGLSNVLLTPPSVGPTSQTATTGDVDGKRKGWRATHAMIAKSYPRCRTDSSRPLRSTSERRREGDCFARGREIRQPGEEEAEIVADGGKNDVGQ
jgi:hypothetical protein